MAQLHDTIISGSLRTTGDIYTPSLQAQKLQVPTTSNGTTYSVGSDGQIIKSNGTSVYWDAANNHEHIISDVKPIQTKTYTGLIATENNTRYGTFYFLKLYPNAWDCLWHVKYHIHITADGASLAEGDYFVEYWGRAGSLIAQYIWNTVNHSSYRPIYYHAMCCASAAGYNHTSKYNHYIGESIASSWNPTTAANARTFNVELLEYDGCTASLLDTAVLPDGISGLAESSGVYSSTLTGQALYNAYTNGLSETNDSDDTYRLRREAGNWTVAPGGPLYRYQLVVQVDSNKVAPLNYVNNAPSNMSKPMNTDLEFDPFGIIEYYNSTTGISAGDPVTGTNLYKEITTTLSYSFNVNAATNALTAHKAVYLKCELQSNGKVKMACANSTASPLVQDLPTTDDNYLYIYLGTAYGTYNMVLEVNHPVYYCKNGRISLYTGLEFPVPVSYGGTGHTSLQATRNAMGLGNTTGPLPIANGGTGSDTADGGRIGLNAAIGTYTEGEVDTGFLWIDGRKIYRYVKQYTLDSSATKVVTLGTLPRTVSDVIRLDCTIKSDGSWCASSWITYYNINTNNPRIATVHIGGNTISLWIGTGMSGMTKLVTVVVEYTDSDEAVSTCCIFIIIQTLMVYTLKTMLSDY
jgi:hypothetical protein